MSLGNRLLFLNGAVSHAPAPPVTTLLELHPGAYTTTRTHRSSSEILFWDRHLQRLTNSFKLLLKSNPKFLFDMPENDNGLFLELSNGTITWDSKIPCLINHSMRKVMPFVLKERESVEEFAITILVSGNSANLSCFEDGFDETRVSDVLDVHVHVGTYVPPVFGVGGSGARLAVVGQGRDMANAKYSGWVRSRKTLEKLRPPSVTELLLSNDGEHILEGCLTNVFLVCRKETDDAIDNYEQNDLPTSTSFEVQTAPLDDGVLPGVVRQVIKEYISLILILLSITSTCTNLSPESVTVLKTCISPDSICLKIGIPFREIAPSWSQRELWTEAFITNSLRLIQHVEAVQTPSTWKCVESKTWEEITWVEKIFEDVPGRITSIIQSREQRDLHESR
ncbi:hypothetical protein F511_01770 [Dorcoceras hygrometricum]|uniref:Aminotransferase class IV n=1 Tax=Dorcoceras hygrometricum TaxID=472368 RepID=A0A2Z7ASD8_9LAMI|nr:hypothetical protein F511_01770 [Dorcoceras hygrometricum]